VYIKKRQFLGPENKTTLIVLRATKQHPRILSNGQWAVLGKAAEMLTPGTVGLWSKELTQRLDREEVRLGDMTRPYAKKKVQALMQGQLECIHSQNSSLFEACFEPEEKQRTLVYEKLFTLDQTDTLMRRPLTLTSGAQLDKEGQPIAYQWHFSYPTPHNIWLYAEYVTLLVRIGGRFLEYAPENKAILIKCAKGSLLGAVAPYYPHTS